MSNCSTQAYASFKLADPSVSEEEILAHLSNIIHAEVHSKSFDAESAYSPLAQAFDYEDAFNAFQVDEYEFSQYFRLTINDGYVNLEGLPLLNEDDHVTRWSAWVLFRQFGEGDVLNVSSKTIEDEGTSGCIFKVDRNGSVDMKSYFVKPEEE